MNKMGRGRGRGNGLGESEEKEKGVKEGATPAADCSAKKE